jgi:hypothetical protein
VAIASVPFFSLSLSAAFLHCNVPLVLGRMVVMDVNKVCVGSRNKEVFCRRVSDLITLRSQRAGLTAPQHLRHCRSNP